MSLGSYLKTRLYDFGLDETARAELSTFIRGTIAMGVERVRRSGRNPPEGQYLHLGCGLDAIPGFLNIDRARTSATDLVADIRRKLPFSTGSVRGIFHQHAFEHIDRPIGARTLLRESARVLVPGGFLRMGVPDLRRYVDAYLGFDASFGERVGLTEARYAAELINFAFAHGHRFLYDFDALRFELRAAGFADIRKAAFRDSADPMLNQDKDEAGRRADTLFVEARKEPARGDP